AGAVLRASALALAPDVFQALLGRRAQALPGAHAAAPADGLGGAQLGGLQTDHAQGAGHRAGRRRGLNQARFSHGLDVEPPLATGFGYPAAGAGAPWPPTRPV